MKEKLRILYAEDDRDMAKLCKEFLEFRGFEVSVAGNGNEAWAMYRKERPDVVLLDIYMPGKSGYDVAKLIRNCNDTVPILFLTSLGSSYDAVTALSLGANDFIRKEVMLAEVEARIRNVLRNHVERERTIFRLSAKTTFNSITCELTTGEKTIRLRPHESLVLKELCCCMNKRIGKEEIAMAIWDSYDKGKDAYIDRHIMRLRKFLSDDPALSIITYYGSGYCLVDKQENANPG